MSEETLRKITMSVNDQIEMFTETRVRAFMTDKEMERKLKEIERKKD